MVAWSVTNVSIEPSGALTPGTQVLVSVRIDLPVDPLFPQNHELRYSTDLEKPIWDPDIIADGIENPGIIESGKINSFAGFELSDPDVQAVRLTLGGIAPAGASCGEGAKNISIIKIEELDEKGSVVGGSARSWRALVIYTMDCISPMMPLRADLETFRSHIAEKAALGVNTTGAEEKYAEAEKKLRQAGALPESQATAALNLTLAAQADIDDGERLLDKAWAEKEIADAEGILKKTDAVIGWFRGNQSTADTPELSPIIAKREIALTYISYAHEKIAAGNYAYARENAHDAYLKANESYYDALAAPRPVYIGEPQCIYFYHVPLCTLYAKAVPIAAGIVLVIGAAAGIWLWRRRAG